MIEGLGVGRIGFEADEFVERCVGGFVVARSFGDQALIHQTFKSLPVIGFLAERGMCTESRDYGQRDKGRAGRVDEHSVVLPASGNIFACSRDRGSLAYTECWAKKRQGWLLDGPIFNEEYLRRLVDGDETTELHFTTYFSDHLRIKLRSRLRSSQMIEDVKQETFLRVFRQLRASRSIDQPEKLGAFVNAVCNHVLFETYRSQSKYQGTAHETPEQRDESWRPDEAFVNDERKRQVREMLAELPERERRVLKALFLDEQDKDEICRDFGVDREYLRVLVHRAKNRARGILVKQSAARN
jgi:RNA polymerase sigma-70 factor (ECF subfamily)